MHSPHPRNEQKIEYLALAGIVFELIEDMPMDRIKRCRENDDGEGKCERLFIQQTGRERKFCCDYCKNRYNLRNPKKPAQPEAEDSNGRNSS